MEKILQGIIIAVTVVSIIDLLFGDAIDRFYEIQKEMRGNESENGQENP